MISGGSPAEQRLRAQEMAHESWAATRDRAERLAPAWQAREDRFAKLVDPDSRMTPQARAQAAASARKAFYTRLSRLGLEARRARRGQSKP